MVSDKALFICRQNRDAAEVELANVLSEDSNNDSMSYVDYVSTQERENIVLSLIHYSDFLFVCISQLCHVHRIISGELSGQINAAKSDDSMWRGW